MNTGKYPTVCSLTVEWFFVLSDYLVVQSVGQKKQSSIKAPCWAKYFIMLEEKSRSQTTRLHLRIVVHMVLIKDPLRSWQDAKIVCCQCNCSATCSCESTNTYRSNLICISVNNQMYMCRLFKWLLIANNDKPVFDSLTCSMACLVLIPESWKSLRCPPLSPSFTSWNPDETSRTANQNTVKRISMCIL